MGKSKIKIKPKLSQWEIIEDGDDLQSFQDGGKYPLIKEGGYIPIAQNGKKLGYSWSTQKQEPVKLTTPNYTTTKTEGRDKPLTEKEIEEFRKHTENLKLQQQQKELAERKARVQQSIQAQNQPFSAQNLATETQAIGDKFRFFPNAPSDSFKGVVDDYLNPFKMVGDMASGLGSVPYNVQQGNYGQAALAVGIPLGVGALAGIGTNSTKQFVNNLANPLAGIERPNFLRRNRLPDLPPPPLENYDIIGITPPSNRQWQQRPIEENIHIETAWQNTNPYRGVDLDIDRYPNLVENIQINQRDPTIQAFHDMMQGTGNINYDNIIINSSDFLNPSPRIQLKNAIKNPKRTLARLRYDYERGALNPKSLYYNQFMDALPGDKIGGHGLFGNAEKGFREAMNKAAEVNPGRMFGESNLSSDSFPLVLAQLRRKAKNVNIIHTGEFVPLNNLGNKSKSLLTAAKNSQEGQESILKYVNEHIEKLNKETGSKIPQAKIIDRKVHIPYILAEKKGASITDKLQRNKTVGLLGAGTATLASIKPTIDYLDNYNQKRFEEGYNNWKKNKPLEDFEKYPVEQKKQGGSIKTDPQGYWNKENIEIKDSKIHGKGVFSKSKFNKNDIIGIAHENGQPVTNLGKFHNHSENPNTESILVGNQRFLKPLRKIKKGEEITVDYRKQPELEQPEDFSFDGNSVVELPLAQNGGNVKPTYNWSNQQTNRFSVNSTENTNISKTTPHKEEHVQKIIQEIKKDPNIKKLKNYAEPNIDPYNSVLNVSNAPGFYNPFNNTIYLNLNKNLGYHQEGFKKTPEYYKEYYDNLKDDAIHNYLMELPHANQVKNYGNVGFINKFLTKDLPLHIKRKITKNNLYSSYNTVGTMEHEAHKILEPIIRDNYLNSDATEYIDEKVPEYYEEAKDFLQKWQNSPIYNDMLKKSADSKEYDKIKKFRQNYIETGNYFKNVKKFDPVLGFDSEAYATPNNGTIHLNPESLKKQKDFVFKKRITNLFSEPPLVSDKLPYPINRNDDIPSKIVHELTHNTDKQGIPKKDLNLIENYTKTVENNETNNYLKQPTEVRARLNEIRYQMKLLGIYDPYTEKVDKEKLGNYIFKNKANKKPLKDLKNILTDDEIIDMLNSISENKQEDNSIPIAQNGISLDEFRPKFANSNEGIQKNIIEQDNIKNSDVYQKQVILKAIQEAEEANRKKYKPSDAVLKTKAAIAAAQIANPANIYIRAVGTGADLATAINYGLDGQYDKAKQDLVQAGLNWIPFLKGKPGLKQGTYNLSQFDKYFNTGNKIIQTGNDTKTITEAFQTGGNIKTDPQGYWNKENLGQPVIIPSNYISMQNVDFPVMGVSNTGDKKIMHPNKKYKFKGKQVLEIPLKKNGGKTKNSDWELID